MQVLIQEHEQKANKKSEQEKRAPKGAHKESETCYKTDNKFIIQ